MNPPVEFHSIKPGAAGRAEWLALRKNDVTASAVGAVLGKHEYLTAFTLWGLKTGRLDEDPDETGPMQRGRLLEPVAVELLREQNPKWTIDRPSIYLRDPSIRLGATPDVYAHHPDKGLGIVQIKSVEPSVYRRKWRDPDSSEVQPPLWIVLQSLVEAHLAGAKWASVAALVVGHGLDLHVVDVPLHEEAIETTRLAVADFWRMVESGATPPMDYAADAENIARLYAQDTGEEIDLSADERFNSLVALKDSASQVKNAAEKELKAVNAEILATMKEAAVARFAGGKVSAKTINRKAYAVAESSYRSPRITWNKDTEQ